MILAEIDPGRDSNSSVKCTTSISSDGRTSRSSSLIRKDPEEACESGISYEKADLTGEMGIQPPFRIA